MCKLYHFRRIPHHLFILITFRYWNFVITVLCRWLGLFFFTQTLTRSHPLVEISLLFFVFFFLAHIYSGGSMKTSSILRIITIIIIEYPFSLADSHCEHDCAEQFGSSFCTVCCGRLGQWVNRTEWERYWDTVCTIRSTHCKYYYIVFLVSIVHIDTNCLLRSLSLNAMRPFNVLRLCWFSK